MPLPKAPQKPADILSALPRSASLAALSQAQTETVPTNLATSASEPGAKTRASSFNSVEKNIALVQVQTTPQDFKPVALSRTKPSPSAAPRNSKEPYKTASKVIDKVIDKVNDKVIDKVKKLYVLDTNVLLHDPSSLFRFDEHDVFLPMVVLEELDNHKKGTTEVARHARQVSRSLDRLVNQADADIATGVPLRSAEGSNFAGYLHFQTDLIHTAVPQGLAPGVPDHLILGELQRLAAAHAPLPVVLVSKDINIRLKATVLGLAAQDYLNDNTTQDSDTLHSGWIDASDYSASDLNLVEAWQDNGVAHAKLAGKSIASIVMNSFVLLPEALDADAYFDLGARVIECTPQHVIVKAVRDFTLPKNAVWGVQARNLEQNAALNLLTNPEVDCVSLLGQAGTGKTLLALAAGLAQVLDKRIYSEIILTRATVSVGDDIGFLPGTEEEKMAPWMGAVEDNLEVLLGSNKQGGAAGGAGAWGQQASLDLVRSRIKIKSMAFMRGRTFQNKFVIVDEAQNLTPKQMKTLVTRAGPGTKFICLGNLAQIDTPYLTEHSSGLGYVIERFKGWPHGGHVTLARGERSRLAEFASEVL